MGYTSVAGTCLNYLCMLYDARQASFSALFTCGRRTLWPARHCVLGFQSRSVAFQRLLVRAGRVGISGVSVKSLRAKTF
ncbi:hypothetical protein DID88_005736 [Monilinia fructigena]|uniref:Uncharacterized protein n=1 Tax=Monilinia fructigena TaxID=38457 RepID=A0A395J1D1_9HELO|nr:hypothetical protein DID88_005736 [Monilinia fructigena]